MAAVRLRTLSSLRFIAAIALVLYHVVPTWPGVHYGAFSELSLSFHTLACVGLPFFYALSGFVLFYAYEARAPRGRRLWLFWRRRFARLAPMFYVSLALAIPAGLAALRRALPEGEVRGFAARALLTSGAFLAAWWPPALVFNFPTWSVSAEMFFYALFPALLPLASALKGRGTVLILGGLYLAALACHVYANFLHPGLLRWPWVPGNLPKHVTDFYQLNPIVHLPEFAAGVFLGRARKLAGPAQNPTEGDLLMLGGMAAFVVVAASGWRPPYLMATSFLFLPLIALVVWGAAGPRGKAFRFLEHPKAVLLGESAYAIYVLHMPLAGFFPVLMPEAPALSILIYLLILIAVATAGHVYFEEPLRRRLAGSKAE